MSRTLQLRPSPAILGATIRHLLDSCENANPELTETINLLRECLYFDDFLSGAQNVKKAMEICQNSKTIMKEGGFNLRKWRSNNKEVIGAFKSSVESELPRAEPSFKQDKSYAKATTGPKENLDDKHVKVLDTNWNTESDEFLFNFADLIDLARSIPVTKRSLLKLTAKIFDPLVLLSPFVIKLKILLFKNFAFKISTGMKTSMDPSCQYGNRLYRNWSH